jgi:hypothetical protein
MIRAECIEIDYDFKGRPIAGRRYYRRQNSDGEILGYDDVEKCFESEDDALAYLKARSKDWSEDRLTWNGEVSGPYFEGSGDGVFVGCGHTICYSREVY